MSVTVQYIEDENLHWLDVDIPDQKNDEVIEISLTSSFGDQIAKMKLFGPKHRIDISEIKLSILNVKVVTKNSTVMKVITIGECIGNDNIT